MKTKIHPEYVTSLVHCACGNSFETRSTKPDLHVEICSNCHPFFTGQQRIVDTAGRVERFAKRLEKSQVAKAAVKPKKAKKQLFEIDTKAVLAAEAAAEAEAEMRAERAKARAERAAAAAEKASAREPEANVDAVRNAEVVPEAAAAPKDEDVPEAASGPASGPATEEQAEA
jgi:large subunit ribosomal protein L31